MREQLARQRLAKIPCAICHVERVIEFLEQLITPE